MSLFIISSIPPLARVILAAVTERNRFMDSTLFPVIVENKVD